MQEGARDSRHVAVRAWALVLAMSTCGPADRHRSSAAPIAPLGPAWRARITDPTSIGGRLFARGGDGAWVEVDAAGRASRAIAAKDARILAGASSPELVVVADGTPILRAIETSTARVRWQVRCHPGSEDPCSVSGGHGGGLVVFAGRIEYRAREGNPAIVDVKAGAFAVDAATGRELWRSAIDGANPNDTSVVELDEGRAYVRDPDGAVWALDRATGATAWARVHPRQVAQIGKHRLSVGGGRVAFGTGFLRERVHVVDASSGAERWGVEWRGTIERLALHEGSLYVAGERDYQRATLDAFDAATGRLRWSYEVPVADRDRREIELVDARFAGGHAFLWIGVPNRREFTRTRLPDELRVVDLSSGALASALPLGHVRSVALVAAEGQSPFAVAQIAEDESVAVRPGAADGPRAVTIEGRARWNDDVRTPHANSRVRVGEAVTTTDEAGAFSVSLVARGPVPVALVDEPDPPPLAHRSGAFGMATTTWVFVDATRDRYQADVPIVLTYPK